MKLHHYLLLSVPLMNSTGYFSSINDIQAMDLPSPAISPGNEEMSNEEKNTIFEEYFDKLKIYLEFNGETIDEGYKEIKRNNIINDNVVMLFVPFNPKTDIEENRKKLKDVFDVIVKMKWLKELLIINMGLDFLPTGIENLKSLEILNLKNNNLKTIPISIIKQLNSLGVIILDGNPIVKRSDDQYNFGIKEILENGYYTPYINRLMM